MGLVFAIWCVSVFWFAAGALTAGWMMHCGRTNRSPIPAVKLPWASEPETAATNGDARPRVGIPSRAGN